MKKFYKVKTIDYYGEYDGLNGKELENKIKIKVLFPDNSTKRTTLHIQFGQDSTQIDMNNHPDSFPTAKAYIIENIKGNQTKVFLRNSEIKIEEII